MENNNNNCFCKSLLKPPPNFNLTQLQILPIEFLLKLPDFNFNCFNNKLQRTSSSTSSSQSTIIDNDKSLMNTFLTNTIFVIIIISILIILLIILTYLLVKLYLSKNCLCFKQFNSSTTKTIKNQQTETTNISFLDTNSNLILIPANSLGFSTNSVKTSSTSPISNKTTTTTSGGSSSFNEHDNSEQQQHFYESIQDLNAEYYFDCENSQPVVNNMFNNRKFLYIKSHIV
jgi:hypothetical protein